MDHISPAYVQKQLGHSSISITADLYGHWIPGEGKKDLWKALGGENAVHVRKLRLVNRASGAREELPRWDRFTLMGRKAKLTEITGDRRPQWSPVVVSQRCGYHAGRLGTLLGTFSGQAQNKRRNPLGLRLKY